MEIKHILLLIAIGLAVWYIYMPDSFLSILALIRGGTINIPQPQINLPSVPEQVVIQASQSPSSNQPENQTKTIEPASNGKIKIIYGMPQLPTRCQINQDCFSFASNAICDLATGKCYSLM